MFSIIACVLLSAGVPAAEPSPVAAALASRPARTAAPAPLVKRNALVALEFVRGPLTIVAEGRALSAGAAGETVRVLNTTSKATISGEVVGPNRVRVRP
jgi:flagella basal body P-ring formation protein FlgA